MAPKETENNAYAKFWGDKQRALWYVLVFSGVVNVARYDNYMLINSYLTFLLLVFCFFSMTTLMQLGVYEIWKEFYTQKLGDQYPLFPF